MMLRPRQASTAPPTLRACLHHHRGRLRPARLALQQQLIDAAGHTHTHVAVTSATACGSRKAAALSAPLVNSPPAHNARSYSVKCLPKASSEGSQRIIGLRSLPSDSALRALTAAIASGRCPVAESVMRKAAAKRAAVGAGAVATCWNALRAGVGSKLRPAMAESRRWLRHACWQRRVLDDADGALAQDSNTVEVAAADRVGNECCQQLG